MASKVSGVIERVQPNGSSGTAYAIASTAYGYCETAAGTAAKVVDMTDFKLYEGVTIHIKFKEKNSAANPTLNVQGTGAKPIVQYGTTAASTADETSGWYAGAVLSLTYDGTSWIRDQGFNTNTNTWRGVENSLTSDSTSVSLTAAQGKVLKGLIDAMDATTPAASGNATAFIDSITQTDGKITSITKKNIPTVSSSTAGLAPKGAAVSSQSTSTKFLREDGTWAAPSYIANTDEKVSQVGNAEDKDFPIILKNTNNTTDETANVKYSNNTTTDATTTKPFTFNPSTGTLKVTQIKIGTKDDSKGLFPVLNNWNQIGASNLYWYRSYINNYYGGRSHVDNWDAGKNIGTAATASAAATLGTVNFYNTAAAGATQTKTLLTANSTTNSNITITLPKTTGTLALKSELPTLSGLGGIGTITASGTAPLTLSGSKSGTTYTLTGSIADASASASGVVNTDAQTFGGTKTFNGGMHIYGSVSMSGSTVTNMYSGGAYHAGHNSLVLHGDSAGVSGIGFTSQKATDSGNAANINSPSDRAFIQYHAYGVTPAAEGTAPTLATSGELGTLVIGVGNDATDTIRLQAPGNAGILHQIGATAYPIPHTTNTNGTVGGTTTPVYVDGGAIKALSYTIAKSVPSDAVFTDHYAWSDITSKPATATRWPAWSEITSKPTTLSGYGITDAKIASGVITLGSNTITPITSIADLTGSTITATNLRTNLGLSAALRFIGKATTDMSESTTTAPTVTGVTNYAPEVGDVVLDKNSDAEYVCIAKATANNTTTYTWELLGRSGSWATSTHTHGNITNGGLLGTASVAVVTDGSKKITTADLSVSDPTAATTTSTTFIDTISQSAQGKITATKKTLPSASSSVAGIVKLGASGGAATYSHDHNSTYLKLDGSNNMTADVNIIAGDTDKFVNFWYNTGKTAGASWRTGMLGSGSSDTNYFVIQSGTSTTSATAWNNVLRIGQNTYDAGFSGNVYPLTNNSKTLGTSSLKWNNVYATTFTGNLSGNASSADSAKWFMNRGGSTVTISDGPWAHGQAGYGGTNAATVWHQRWKQSGLTYTPSGGSATTLTDSGDMVLWLAQSTTANTLTVNMAVDGIIYAMGGFKGNLNGQANTVARATFGDVNNGEHNANNIKSNGLWYYTSNGPVTALGASTADGAIYSQAYSTYWAGQIAQDYRDGALFVRGLKNGAWQNWYAIPKFTTTTGGLGSTTQPVYIDTNGELQVCTAYDSASVNYATSAGSATTANKLGSTDVGDSETLIYLDGGTATAGNKVFTIQGGTSIPSNANMSSYKTIGNYYCSADSYAKTITNSPFGANASNSHLSFTLKIEASLGAGTQYLRQYWRGYNSGVEAERTSTNSGSSWGGWRTKVFKNSNAATAEGSSKQPVYVSATGAVAAIDYTIEKSVPSNAVFTDHHAWTDITGKPTKITLTGAVTGSVSLGEGDLSLATTVNHNHDSLYVKKITSTDNAIVRFDGTDGAVQDSSVKIDDNGHIIVGAAQPIHQYQADTSNYTAIANWLKGGKGWIKEGTTYYTYQPQIGQHNTGGDGTGSLIILPYPTDSAPWGGTVGLFIRKGQISLDNNRIPHTGNTTGTIGSTKKPVYVDAGQIKEISYTIEKSVPSNAVFTDHYAWSDITSKPETATRWPKWNEIAAGADALNEGTSAWTDNTEILTSYASNNGFADTNSKGVVYRRDAICAYNYIKGKLDSVYVAKTAGVTAVTWDATNKKLTRTINGSAADVMTAAQMSTALELGTIASKDTTDFVPFTGILTSLGSGTPAAATKTYWTDNIPNNNVSIGYNSSGTENTIIFSRGGSQNVGTILKYGYNDAYIYMLRQVNGWKSTDWEKISAGYADTAGSATSATHANYLTGFSSRATTMAWGNQTGSVVTCLATPKGGGWGFRDDNPAAGQVSMTIDGTVYIKEGGVNIANAVKSFSVSGQTVTYTNLWGNTGTFTTQDTKNTAGSTNSDSKLYLIGATSQDANPQTYSDAHVFETNGAFSAKTLGVNADTDSNKVTLQYNTTDSSLEFVFA